MKLSTRTICTSLSIFALVALFSGCGKKEQGACCPAEKLEATPAAAACDPVVVARGPGVQVAIVPDADLLCYIDLAGMREAPIIKTIKAKREAAGQTAPGQMGEPEWEKVKALTGMDETDMLSLLISADLDTIDVTNPRLHQEVKGVNGACAIALSKPLPFASILECMGVMSSRSGKERHEQIELAGRPVARVLPSSPKEPVVHAAASASEMTLLIAFTEEAMTAMIQRDTEGQPATPDPNLTRLGSTIADGTQVRLLLLASDAIREKISKQLDSLSDSKPQEQQTQMGIIAGFFSPLRSTQNIVLWAKAAEAIDLHFALELGNASQAQQCSHLIQSFVVPMISKSFEATDPDNKMQIDDSLEAINEDNTLVFKLKVAEQDVLNWQQPGS